MSCEVEGVEVMRLVKAGMNRRKFLGYAASSAVSISLASRSAFAFGAADPGSITEASLPRPTAAQLAWQNFEVGVLFSTDLPVFAPGGWTDKLQTYDPNLFNPTQLDTDQWLESAKEAGAKYAVFTATHFNGFLMWQSDLYPYGLKQSSWRGGKADVMQMFVESCHKYKIAPGVFLSCHGNAYEKVENYRVNYGKGGVGQAAFAELGAKMTEELCARFGPLCEIWYDASLLAPDDGGPNVLPIVDRYQKNTVFYSNPQRHDHRWIGNEAGFAGDPCWSTMPDQEAAYRSHMNSGQPGMRALDSHGDPNGKIWCPAMVDIPIRNHEWFWRPNDEHKLYTPEALVNLYYTSVGLNSNFILGAVPDTRGLVPEKDFAVGAAFGKEIRRRFSVPLAETKGHGNAVELKLRKPARIDHIAVMEEISQGERIREYTLEALVPGNTWQKIFDGQSIGHKRIVKFSPMEVAKVRLSVTRSIGQPLIRQLAVYATS
jgi:alpha-L-fucosidase